MQARDIPKTPQLGERISSASRNDTDMASSPLIEASMSSTNRPILALGMRGPPSPVRFAASTNAFGLTGSPNSSSPSSSKDVHAGYPATGLVLDKSPPSAGTVTTKKLRRPSMLSLAQTASFGPRTSSSASDVRENGRKERGGSRDADADDENENEDGRHPLSSQAGLTKMIDNPFAPRPLKPPAWRGLMGPAGASLLQRTSSAPPIGIEMLSTTTPPIPSTGRLDSDGSGSASPMELEGGETLDARLPLRWMPQHLQPPTTRRKGKGRAEDFDDIVEPSRTSGQRPFHGPPLSGRPLPASLLATLVSESSPLEHEMRSEARLQRLLSSHPSALPLTPRAPRSSRGRFPEMVGGDDDDDDEMSFRRPSWARHSWARRGSSDSDSDEMPDDPPTEPVNAAFAAGMDMDRAGSSSSSVIMGTAVSESGKSTPASQAQPAALPQIQEGQTPPPLNGPWPGALRGGTTRMSFSSAGAGMVPSPGSGTGLPSAFGGLGMGGAGTPLASPTIERLELAGSPGSLSMASPGYMQYRESGSASVRPGKRKAQVDDRFDPYKRPRGSSPGLLNGSSPFPMSPSRGSISIPVPQSPSLAPMFSSHRPVKGAHHPYSRPMSSRSRAASPALSIGSTSGVLSTSLGRDGISSSGPSRGFSLAAAFCGPGVNAAVNAANSQGAAPQALGSLGLLSLANGGMQTDRDEGVEVIREDSEEGRSAMEED